MVVHERHPRADGLDREQLWSKESALPQGRHGAVLSDGQTLEPPSGSLAHCGWVLHENTIAGYESSKTLRGGDQTAVGKNRESLEVERQLAAEAALVGADDRRECRLR